MVTLTYQERFKTDKGVFDEFTKRTLFELQSKGCFDDIVSPLKVGKESNVFIAKKGTQKLIVKIYRMQNCDFNTMYSYIRTDPRYTFLKKHRRQIIIAWTQREYKNLIKAKRAGVHVPEPLDWRNHVLIEEFIGNNDEPAPPLKDAPPKNPQAFFTEITRQIKILHEGGLVHGDLSSFNILNHNEKPVLIDFSQATVTTTPNWDELLRRDLGNIARYFQKLGIAADKEILFEEITKKKESKEARF